jgi:hypothetical protein
MKINSVAGYRLKSLMMDKDRQRYWITTELPVFRREGVHPLPQPGRAHLGWFGRG